MMLHKSADRKSLSFIFLPQSPERNKPPKTNQHWILEPWCFITADQDMVFPGSHLQHLALKVATSQRCLHHLHQTWPTESDARPHQYLPGQWPPRPDQGCASSRSAGWGNICWRPAGCRKPGPARTPPVGSSSRTTCWTRPASMETTATRIIFTRFMTRHHLYQHYNNTTENTIATTVTGNTTNSNAKNKSRSPRATKAIIKNNNYSNNHNNYDSSR